MLVPLQSRATGRVQQLFLVLRLYYSCMKAMPQLGICTEVCHLHAAWQGHCCSSCCCCYPRYLFVRCDNAPAPWTSDDTGDKVRLDIPELAAKEIKAAQGLVYEMGDNPYW